MILLTATWQDVTMMGLVFAFQAICLWLIFRKKNDE